MVLAEINSRIGYITLNNPEKRNALGPEMVAALKKEINVFLENKSIKVIVIKGNGPAFCAGADLEYLSKIRNFSHEENLADSGNLRELFDLIYYADKIFISQVEGPALAGGCGLASICDFCYASVDATFGYTEARIGFIPALVMVYLQHRITGANLRELLLTSKILSAEKALQIGLINGIFQADTLGVKTLEFAEDICRNISSSSIKYIKKMLREIPEMDLPVALDYAAKMNAEARKSEDCIRGINAFLNKEKIQW